MPSEDVLRVAYVLASSLWAVPAIAQTATGDQSSSAGKLWEQSNLLGDMAGLRPLLGKYGISFGLSETSQVFGNVTGGVHQGADYEGMTEKSLGLDSSKAFGWQGGISTSVPCRSTAAISTPTTLTRYRASAASRPSIPRASGRFGTSSHSWAESLISSLASKASIRNS
jgi:hypothetical protein